MLSIETRESDRAMRRPNSVALAILVLLAIAASAPSAAGQDAPTPSIPPGLRTIIVEGNGEVRAKPDTASINVAIETHAATADQASQLNATLADKVSTALRSKLGDKGRIETGGYSLVPQYDQRPGHQTGRVIGYSAVNSVTVETGDTSLIGPLVDTAIVAGSNRINSLEFTLKNDTQARGEAVAKASKDAQAQASALAASLDVKLKRIYTASTVSEVQATAFSGFQVSGMATGASRGFGTQTPMEAGEVTVPAHVSLVYEIE